MAGITLSTSAITILENGGTGTFTVVLDTLPTADVVLSVTSATPGKATVNISSLTFTTSNWSTSQTVTITGVNNDIDENPDPTVIITVSIASTNDTTYSSVPDKTVTVTITDDDTSGFVISRTNVFLTDIGKTDTFTVVLTSLPTGNVVTDILSADSSKIVVSPSRLTFTTSDWNTPKTVTLLRVNNLLTNLDKVTRVTVGINQALTLDTSYDSVLSQVVLVTNNSSQRRYIYNFTPVRSSSYGLRLLFNSNTFSLTNQSKGIGMANTASGKRASRRR